MIGIWKFCLMTKTWRRLTGLEFDDYYVSCCCLKLDEGYVIIGGCDYKCSSPINKWYVLDIRKEDEYKLMECNIELPVNMNGNYKMVRSGGGIKDEMLVVRWRKQQFEKNDFKDL